MAETKVKGSVFDSSDNGISINISDAPYRLKGDGADPGAAINDAISAANEAGSGKVIFPPGTYANSVSIVPQDNVELVGAGDGTVFTHFTGFTDPIIYQAPGGTRVTGFGLNGLKFSETGRTKKIISLADQSVMRWKNVHCVGGSTAIELLGCWDCYYYGLFSTNANEALKLLDNGTESTNNQFFYGCDLESFYVSGLTVDGVSGGTRVVNQNNFYGLKVESTLLGASATHSLLFSGTQANRIYGGHVSIPSATSIAATYAMIKFDGAVNNTIFNGFEIRDEGNTATIDSIFRFSNDLEAVANTSIGGTFELALTGVTCTNGLIYKAGGTLSDVWIKFFKYVNTAGVALSNLTYTEAVIETGYRDHYGNIRMMGSDTKEAALIFRNDTDSKEWRVGRMDSTNDDLRVLDETEKVHLTLRNSALLAAGQTALYLYDADSGLLEPVKVGANGSGSIAAHRMLQVPDV